MFDGNALEPDATVVSRFICPAGTAGVLANLGLIAMYALLDLWAGTPGDVIRVGSGFRVAGSASDLLGWFSTTFMIPVALCLSKRLSRRRTTRLSQAAGLVATVILTIGVPLLVVGVLSFEVETSIAMAALFVLSLWLLLVNRWLCRSATFPYRLVGFGVSVEAGFLAGYVIAEFGLLVPWMWWPQLVVFGVGVLVGLPAYLGFPLWFVFLGGNLGASAG